jgi:hypothetical protein
VTAGPARIDGEARARNVTLLGVPGAAWLIAGAMCALLLACANAYGFHRDEMYFIVAGRHPDLGYVDQPPLTPLLSAAAAALLGVTPLAVRVAPALAAAAGVVVTADIARRLGSSRAGEHERRRRLQRWLRPSCLRPQSSSAPLTRGSRAWYHAPRG